LRGQAGSKLAVAEHYRCLILVVGTRDIAAILWSQIDDVLGLMPEQIIDTYLQRTFRAGRSWRRQVDEWRLSQIEFLHRPAAVAVAKHFLLCLAVSRFHHVPVDGHRVAF